MTISNITKAYATSLDDMRDIASILAAIVDTGDIICLKGTLGAGKTTFSQFFINAYFGKEMGVTSPTFTLVQQYEENQRTPIWHCDFYRLKNENEIYELGIEDAFDHSITLIEWPEIAQNHLPGTQLELQIDILPASSDNEADIREVSFSTDGELGKKFGKEILKWQQKENRQSSHS